MSNNGENIDPEKYAQDTLLGLVKLSSDQAKSLWKKHCVRTGIDEQIACSRIDTLFSQRNATVLSLSEINNQLINFKDSYGNYTTEYGISAREAYGLIKRNNDLASNLDATSKRVLADPKITSIYENNQITNPTSSSTLAANHSQKTYDINTSSHGTLITSLLYFLDHDKGNDREVDKQQIAGALGVQFHDNTDIHAAVKALTSALEKGNQTSEDLQKTIDSAKTPVDMPHKSGKKHL